MAFRRKLNRGDSKRMFSRTAGNEKVHPKNMQNLIPTRGGYRL